MTDYKLQDFKTWLRENPSQSRNLDWERFYRHCNTNSAFKYFIVWGVFQGVDYSSTYWEPWHQVVWQWITWEVSSLKVQIQGLERQLEQKDQELTTGRETTQQALQTSQEWHERQKREIIAEWKQKLTNLIQQRKNQITQQLTLIREILRNSHDMTGRNDNEYEQQ